VLPKTLLLFVVFCVLTISAVAAQKNACDLVRADEVSAAFGPGFKTGMPIPGAEGDDLCAFRTPQGTALVVALHASLGKTRFETAKAKWMKAGGNVVTVSGVGDQAMCLTRPRATDLMVLKGNVALALGLTGPLGKPAREGLTSLARKALARM
jgi:hypothetical protein